MKIKTVTVLGANGTMGKNVAGIFASFGDAKVYMLSREMEKSQRAALDAAASVKADSVLKNLIPGDYSLLSSCVGESDLVFESLAENMDVKLRFTREVAKALRPDAIAASGTSGLSVTALAECFPPALRSRFFGVHLFNPPYSMSLCEVIPTRFSDPDLLTDLKAYLREPLLRTVVQVKDSPAFLGNRIGFQFINEALQTAEKKQDNGGIDYLDAILAPCTGRSMAPLATSDFVGLDVHQAIVDNLYQNTDDYARATFRMPGFARELVKQGKLGRKAGCGLFKMEKFDGGLRRLTVYDIRGGTYRERIPYVFPFKEAMLRNLRVGNYEKAFQELLSNHSPEACLCVEFLLKYVVYALSAAQTVGYDLQDADDVMAAGYNWCPPLAMMDALSTVADFPSLLRERLEPSLLGAVDVEKLMSLVRPSRYDYRLYFKAIG